MRRYLTIAVSILLALSLLSGCEIKKPFSVTHYTSECDYSNIVHINRENSYMDAYEGNEGKYRSFSVMNSYESVVIDNGENIIPYTYCVVNDYIYYGHYSLNEAENLICSVWKQDINDGNKNYKVIEFSDEYRLLQMTVDTEGKIYIFVKDSKDSDGKSVSSYFLNKYDTEGNIIWSRDISDILVYDNGKTIENINDYGIWLDSYESADYFYGRPFYGKFNEVRRAVYDVNAVYLDDNGDLYAASECGVSIFSSEDGALKSWFLLWRSPNDYFNHVIGIVSDYSGKKYVLIQATDNYNLIEINKKGANKNNALHFLIDEIIYSNHNYDYDDHHLNDKYIIDKNTAPYGLNHDLLMRSKEYVYGVDLKSMTVKKLFMFANVGVDCENVKFVAELPDGRILISEELPDKKVEVTVVTPDGEDEREILSLTIHNSSIFDSKSRRAWFENYMKVQKEVAEFNGNNKDYRIIAAYAYDLTNEYDESKFDIISTDGKLSGDMAWLLDDYEIEYDTYWK